MKTDKQINQKVTEKTAYQKPAIEIIEMETEGSILQASVPDLPGEDW